VAAIVAEPGVGKSRLVYEFRHSHRMEGWLVLGRSSVSCGKGTELATILAPEIAFYRRWCGYRCTTSWRTRLVPQLRRART
jgi:hypothetical protein